jgi:membrane-associated phospholipid phosphatase
VNILRGAAGVFSPESVRPLLVGSVLAGTGGLLDDEVQHAVGDDDDPLADFVGDYMGPVELGVLTLGLFIGGQCSESPRFRAMSYDLSEAAIVNLGYTSALKAAVSRERPDGSDEDSFPSGHTSSAFALASVASAHYGKKVGIPAYAVASAIGASRLGSDVHWLSDVVVGATLGSLVGWAVVRQNNKPTENEALSKRIVNVMPVLSPGFQGVQFEINF